MKSKKIVLLVIGAVIISVGFFYLGYSKGVLYPKEIIVRGIDNLEEDEINVNFGIFWQVWDKIKKDYIDGESAKDQDLVYGAVGGMVDALKDPNTVFFPPEDAKKFEEDVSGSFGGIGAEIGIRNEQLVIIAPLKDSPAERSSLKSNDKILLIDKTPTTGLDVNEAVKIIRGEIGTKVTLAILRNGWSEPKDFTITRETIKVPTLDFTMTDDQIAHLQLYSFNENANYLFYQAALKTLTGDARGMILDLRNNPGGYLEVAVDLASWFIDRGKLVVSEKFRSGAETAFRANGNGALKNLPIVVLVNQGSASASEILAGALRDQRGAKLVGEKTFGKGSVQEVMPLADNSSLKVTIAHWVLPSGQIIDKTGLAPDFEVKLTDEDREAERDPQLDKALEVLRLQLEPVKSS
ncbi:MAG: hypothetical protein A3I24_03860 [Candidatus Harrisonbacteria bacterium RIFCSPLOWO2_02_FULL_41_13b]|uniref:PDZ domain-containing protein n=1 Tax=Candidatus Harrisonbacteria bacterium RIFCSPLOWO2_02_FULL_41_13b TaxID=1798409 RepID=A0A1G1ZQ77_9BACT|nr:MAG: hypothetical protein A3J53_01980 [Candidatus Harrisonbacteria bacterium RIFCSPHIGHO2_02_FULL_40_20]OGY66661.1 MAG: hypothetical protein A3I24_03860 [Candidatus Harrisonbacteria bacterium RIFCSPLOWO2_02_FULL_41_13b]